MAGEAAELDLAEAELLQKLQDEFDEEGAADANETDTYSEKKSILANGHAQNDIVAEASPLEFVRRPLLGKNVPMQLPPCKKLAVGQGNAVNALQSQATRGVATPKTAKAAEQICRKAKPAQNVDPDPDIIVAIMSGDRDHPDKNAGGQAAGLGRGTQGPVKGRGKENKAPGTPAGPRKRTAYAIFCDEQVAKGDPRQTSNKKAFTPRQLWNSLAEDKKKLYKDQADQQNNDDKTNDDETSDPTAANVAMSKAPAAAAKGKGRARKVKARRKKNQTAKKESALLAEHTGAESDDDEDYRQDCDWKKHPAEAILAMTEHKKLVVKRKGLDLTEYGLVDAGIVKRQRLNKNAESPVSLEMLEEFEAWESQFRSSVEGNTVSGSLELDDLVQHSPLESCYYLGKMLEANYPLSKAKKGWDTSSRFPVLALSMLSQRLLNLEKAKAQKAEARVQELTKRIAQLEAASIR